MKMYVADFETTVDRKPELQTESEVWAFGISEVFDELDHVYIDNSIKKFVDFLKLQKDKHIVVFFVNLKFDGCFLTDYFMQTMKFNNAFDEIKKEFKQDKEMNSGEIKYIITDLGVWYSITVKIGNKIIEFRDLLKLIPLAVRNMPKAFGLDIKKLEMDYQKEGRHAGGDIDDLEKEYIKNDILVPKKALEKFLFEMNCISRTPPLTLGMFAMRIFKQNYPPELFELYFPNLAEFELDPEQYGAKNADEYCRKAYGGGWVYADERNTGKDNGQTYRLDVNSLFPAVMHSSAKKPIGYKYPVGKPTFFKDRTTLNSLLSRQDKFFFIRFKCRFRLKDRMLPFIQIKNDFNYRTNEQLTTSYRDRYGYYRPDLKPTLLLTETMFKLFVRCYKVEDFEFLDGCYFEIEDGGTLFDPYVNKFMKMKQDATKEGNKGKRYCAKIFANVIYGKFGTAPENGFFLIRNDVEGREEELIYTDVKGFDKTPVYVPIAAAITSYAKMTTLNAALMNESVYPNSFRYSDTDSLHICLPKGKAPVGIEIDPVKLGYWKLEAIEDHSIFIRQKTYIEWSGDRFEIKACGLPERSKNLLKCSFLGILPDEQGRVTIPPEEDDEEPISYELTFEEAVFVSEKRTPEDFRQGLSIPGKLKPKKVKGGCVLVNDHFTIL